MGCQREIAEKIRAKGADYLLTLKRKLSLPVSTRWQWCARRSSSAMVILA